MEFERHSVSHEPHGGEGPVYDHFVQFYDSEDHLLETLRSFVSIGLRRGETVLSISSMQHRKELEKLLQQEGDVQGARVHGRYIAIDAEEMLPLFMDRGRPDEERFVRTVESLLARPLREGRPIRGFAEMVALLWASGERKAVLRLEELWDKVGRRHGLVLYCAYPRRFFDGDAAEHQTICGLHAHVLPADPVAARTQLAAG